MKTLIILLCINSGIISASEARFVISGAKDTALLLDTHTGEVWKLEDDGSEWQSMNFEMFLTPDKIYYKKAPHGNLEWIPQKKK